MTIGHRYAVFIGLKLKRGETNHTIHPELVQARMVKKIAPKNAQFSSVGQKLGRYPSQLSQKKDNKPSSVC